MSKSSSSWNAIAIGIVSVLLGLVAFAFTQSIFNLFFVPIIVAVLWDYTVKVQRLEERLSHVEARPSANQSAATQEDPKPSGDS